MHLKCKSAALHAAKVRYIHTGNRVLFSFHNNSLHGNLDHFSSVNTATTHFRLVLYLRYRSQEYASDAWVTACLIISYGV